MSYVEIKNMFKDEFDLNHINQAELKCTAEGKNKNERYDLVQDIDELKKCLANSTITRIAIVMAEPTKGEYIDEND